ncbi:MAG TPA: large conductance mechanosensitive channel protein MscL [Thermoleophilia bacterium]|nr:large conductance mechanosensitive channel protein MscL [Thermoleophilia bacterium]
MKLQELKAFLLRGNVIDLAIAVVIAVAFGAVVTSFVNDILMQIIAAIFGQPDFSALSFSLGDSEIYYGKFLNAVITFVIIGAAVFYFVVVPINAMNARFRKEPPPDPSIKKCPECLSDIPAEARRCAFCASPQAGD